MTPNCLIKNLSEIRVQAHFAIYSEQQTPPSLPLSGELEGVWGLYYCTLPPLHPFDQRILRGLSILGVWVIDKEHDHPLFAIL